MEMPLTPTVNFNVRTFQDKHKSTYIDKHRDFYVRGIERVEDCNQAVVDKLCLQLAIMCFQRSSAVPLQIR